MILKGPTKRVSPSAVMLLFTVNASSFHLKIMISTGNVISPFSHFATLLMNASSQTLFFIIKCIAGYSLELANSLFEDSSLYLIRYQGY